MAKQFACLLFAVCTATTLVVSEVAADPWDVELSGRVDVDETTAQVLFVPVNDFCEPLACFDPPESQDCIPLDLNRDGGSLMTLTLRVDLSDEGSATANINAMNTGPFSVFAEDETFFSPGNTASIGTYNGDLESFELLGEGGGFQLTFRGDIMLVDSRPRRGLPQADFHPELHTTITVHGGGGVDGPVHIIFETDPMVGAGGIDCFPFYSFVEGTLLDGVVRIGD